MVATYYSLLFIYIKLATVVFICTSLLNILFFYHPPPPSSSFFFLHHHIFFFFFFFFFFLPSSTNQEACLLRADRGHYKKDSVDCSRSTERGKLAQSCSSEFHVLHRGHELRVDDCFIVNWHASITGPHADKVLGFAKAQYRLQQGHVLDFTDALTPTKRVKAIEEESNLGEMQGAVTRNLFPIGEPTTRSSD